jgi:hypothetical protein
VSLNWTLQLPLTNLVASDPVSITWIKRAESPKPAARVNQSNRQKVDKGGEMNARCSALTTEN